MSEFAADVLDILKRRNVTFRGLQPAFLQIFMDGRAKCWFYGNENGRMIRKGITVINAGGIEQAIHFGDTNVMAQLIEEGIDHSASRFY